MPFVTLQFVPGKNGRNAGGDADGWEDAAYARPVPGHVTRGQDHFRVGLVAEALNEGAQSAGHLQK